MNEKEKMMQYFRGIQMKFSRLYAHFLTAADLTLPQYALLSILAAAEKAIPMTEVSVKMHISKPAVTYLVDRLERAKFLKRATHPRDRRVTLLEIQAKGVNVVRRAQKLALGFLMETLDEFKPAERNVIGRFYGRLSQAMDLILAKPEKLK